MRSSTRTSLLEATRQRAQSTAHQRDALQRQITRALELLPGDGGVWLLSPRDIAERIKDARAVLRSASA